MEVQDTKLPAFSEKSVSLLKLSYSHILLLYYLKG